MTVRALLLSASSAAILASAIWLAIIFFLDPAKAGIVGYALFFLAFFLAVAGWLTLIGFGIRRLINPEQLSAYRVRGALRQGIMLSLFFNVLLILVRFRLYQWWVAVILTIIFVALEVIFLSYDRSVIQRSQPA